MNPLCKTVRSICGESSFSGFCHELIVCWQIWRSRAVMAVSPDLCRARTGWGPLSVRHKGSTFLLGSRAQGGMMCHVFNGHTVEIVGPSELDLALCSSLDEDWNGGWAVGALLPAHSGTPGRARQCRWWVQVFESEVGSSLRSASPFTCYETARN